MQLKLKRSQKTGGIMAKSVIFALDARAELSSEERAAVERYKLGSLVIYNSEASRRYLDAADHTLSDGTAGGIAKGIASLAMAKMKLNITVDGLTRGQHIECKDLDELLGAEEAIRNACEVLMEYLALAKRFDGSEEIIEFA